MLVGCPHVGMNNHAAEMTGGQLVEKAVERVFQSPDLSPPFRDSVLRMIGKDILPLWPDESVETKKLKAGFSMRPGSP
jgi:hypothetical protein